MPSRERSRIEPAPPTDLVGLQVGTCVSAVEQVSKAGNQMIVWTFDVAGQQIRRFTLRKGAGAASTHETAMALGLGRAFKLSQAAGRQCRVDVQFDGQWHSIQAARPL